MIENHTTPDQNGTLPVHTIKANNALHMITTAITLLPLKAKHKRLTEPTTHKQLKSLSDKNIDNKLHRSKSSQN